MTIRFEDVTGNPDAINALVTFVGGDAIAQSDIDRRQRESINALRTDIRWPENVRRQIHFPVFAVWPEAMRQESNAFTAEFARKQGYTVEYPRALVEGETAPLLSIVIPCYNAEGYLNECLSSVFRQTYENLEVVVVDDGSTDGSRDIAAGFHARYADRMQMLETGDNLGVAEARNRGIAAARGKFLTLLDADDFYANDRKLEHEVLLAMRHDRSERGAIAFSDVVLVDEGSSEIGPFWRSDLIREGRLFEQILTRSCAVPRDFVARRSLYVEAGQFDGSLTPFEDWDHKLRMSRLADWAYTGLLERHTAAIPAGSQICQRYAGKRPCGGTFQKNLPLAEGDRDELQRRFSEYMRSWSQRAFGNESIGGDDETDFEKIAADRLAVIQELERAASERLHVIEQLDSARKQERAELQDALRRMERTADERLAVIRELDATLKRDGTYFRDEIRRLEQIAEERLEVINRLDATLRPQEQPD